MNEKRIMNENGEETFTIDLFRIIQALWKKIWLIALAGLIAAGGAFTWSAFVIKPQYSATAMMYVNNSTFSVGKTNFSISSSDIVAAQSLVKTYIVILKNRTTLNQVIEKTGVKYSYEQLANMITAASVNNTEVFHITVTCEDAQEAATLANCIAEVLPVRVAEIIDGSSMRLVDKAVIKNRKVSPNITKNTALGFIVGAFLAAAVVIILELLDDVIHNDDYLTHTFDLPILARIPDLFEKQSNKYGYYYQNSRKTSKNAAEKKGKENSNGQET